MPRSCNGPCLIRFLPIMLVCVVGMSGCSTGQQFPLQTPVSLRSNTQAAVRTPAQVSAELPYYASQPDLKVYSAPRRGSRVLATLPLHQKILRSDVQRGYARIRTPNGRIQGWVDNALLIWRLPVSRPSDSGIGVVKRAAPPANPTEQEALAEPAAPVEQEALAEPAASAEQEVLAQPAAPVEQAALTEQGVVAESEAPAETSSPDEYTEAFQVRPGAEVFDKF